jgi:hypothetical protein
MANGFVPSVYKNEQCLNEIEGGSGCAFNQGGSDRRRPLAHSKTRGARVHNQDGRVSERNCYRNDPASRLG